MSIRNFVSMLRDRRGVALIEFAFSIPAVLVLGLTGSEVSNYVTTRMRVSQAALHLADNAARMGNGTQLTSKTVTETNINDVLTGVGLQAAELNLFKNGRVILSSFEPVETSSKKISGPYWIHWQRCRGDQKSFNSSFGSAGKDAMTNMGPSNMNVTAPLGGATMYVEVYYKYQPLFAHKILPDDLLTIKEVAAMMVRDRRDLVVNNGTGVQNIEGAPVASC